MRGSAGRDLVRLGARSLYAALVCVAAFVGPLPLAAQGTTELADPLRARLERVAAGSEVGPGGEQLLATEVLEVFYAERDFEPAWLGASSERLLTQLETAVRGAAVHGLDPAEYHLGAIDGLRRAAATAQADLDALVALDLLASDAFALLASHLLRGRSDPTALEAEWLSRRRVAALDRVLADALARDDVTGALFALAPADARYRALVDAASRLQDVVALGGWPPVAVGPPLELGSEGPRVAELRARLLAGGDLSLGASAQTWATDVFDLPVEEAVRRFQARHGLVVDGIVGRATVEALNVSAEARLEQIAINLERWRWLPEDLGERHIEVNVPDFDLRIVEQGRTVRRHRVVVGMEERQTPMLSGVMMQVVLSPTWTVPPTVARQDLLPRIQRDPAVLAAQGMTLLDRATGAVIDPVSVDWSAMSGAELNARYLLRQEPGPLNALGTVKFAFSNGHSIFLHDTPSQSLFERPVRDFSSGCVRVQNAIDLAVYVLADQPEWTRERITEVASSGVETAVPLTRGIPVHLMYWTAWVDDDGVLSFRNDLYGRDDVVRRALLAPPTCS